jgi:hypothetical protein
MPEAFETISPWFMDNDEGEADLLKRVGLTP